MAELTIPVEEALKNGALREDALVETTRAICYSLAELREEVARLREEIVELRRAGAVRAE